MPKAPKEPELSKMLTQSALHFHGGLKLWANSIAWRRAQR